MALIVLTQVEISEHLGQVENERITIDIELIKSDADAIRSLTERVNVFETAAG